MSGRSKEFTTLEIHRDTLAAVKRKAKEERTTMRNVLRKAFLPNMRLSEKEIKDAEAAKAGAAG